MTIREKEHLFPAIETISEWCKGHECGEGCEFYIDHYDDEEGGFTYKDCLFSGTPNRWQKKYEEEQNCKLDSSDIEAAYQRGLEEAWEGARKLLFDSSLSRNILTDLGADSFCGVIHKCSASEAIEKIKEYEEQKKQTEEKTDKSCDDCRFADLTAYEFPCCSCSASHTFRWEARKGASK